MLHLLTRFDRLRAEDPAKAADLLSRLAESDWEMTFKGNPRTEPSGSRWRAQQKPPVDLNPPKNRKVRRFIRNPKGEIDEEYTRDPKFGWELLAYCSDYVDAIPARGQRLMKTALIVFARNQRDGLLEAGCMTIVAKCVLAFSNYLLNNLSEATTTLNTLLESSLEMDCKGCQAITLRKSASLDREQAYLGIDPGGYRRAYDKCTSAIDLYSDPLTTDHDVLGHGRAHSYMTRGTVLTFWDQPEKALSDLSTASSLCAKTSSKLYILCLGNTAVALLKSGKEEHLLRAAELVVGLKKNFSRRRKASTGRAMTLWLEGQISARIGATADAIDCHEEALDDFVELKAFVNSSAVVSDLSKLTAGTPSRIRDHIHRLDPERTHDCPSWMPGYLQHHLSKLYRLSGSRRVGQGILLQAIGDLRKASGCRFPCLI